MDLNKVLTNVANYMFGSVHNKKPNFGEDVRQVLQSENFESQLKTVAPFLACGVLAWPTYWMYRGMEWHKQRAGKDALPLYINKTYYQAKMLQIMILSTGILYTIVSAYQPMPVPNPKPHNTENRPGKTIW